VVTVGHKERGHGGGHGSHGGSLRRWRGGELGRRQRKVMTSGAHLSARHGEGEDGVRLDVFLCGRRQSGRAPLTRGRLGREGEMGRPRGRGLVGRGGGGEKRPVEKKGRGWAECDVKFLFRIKFDF
jgi:hypothetical protein